MDNNSNHSFAMVASIGVWKRTKAKSKKEHLFLALSMPIFGSASRLFLLALEAKVSNYFKACIVYPDTKE